MTLFHAHLKGQHSQFNSIISRKLYHESKDVLDVLSFVYQCLQTSYKLLCNESTKHFDDKTYCKKLFKNHIASPLRSLQNFAKLLLGICEFNSSAALHSSTWHFLINMELMRTEALNSIEQICCSVILVLFSCCTGMGYNIQCFNFSLAECN